MLAFPISTTHKIQLGAEGSVNDFLGIWAQQLDSKCIFLPDGGARENGSGLQKLLQFILRGALMYGQNSTVVYWILQK